MNLKHLLLLSLAVFVGGCASHPGDIAPTFVPSSQYQEISCDGLEEAMAEATTNLADASSRQRRKRTADGAGNILLIPGLLSIIPDSREAVALHKGEIQTISRELDIRCRKDREERI